VRAIIRFSVDNEKNSALRNQLAAVLTRHGFSLNPHVTATWENASIDEPKLATAMLEFWTAAQHPPNGAFIDHVWMYADNPP